MYFVITFYIKKKCDAGYKLVVKGQKYKALSKLVNGIYKPNDKSNQKLVIYCGVTVLYKKIEMNVQEAIAIFTDNEEWRIARVDGIGNQHLKKAQVILSSPCGERRVTDVRMWEMVDRTIQLEVSITPSFAVTHADVSVLLRNLYNEHQRKIGMHCLTRSSPARHISSHITHTHS